MLRLLTLGLQHLESWYNCLAANTGLSDHHVELQCFFPSEQRVEDIIAEAAPNQHSRFSCRQSIVDSIKDLATSRRQPWEGPGRSGGRPPVNVGDRKEGHCWKSSCWKAQPSSQILHRLTASPDTASICLTLLSNTTSQDKLQELAHSWYSILTSSNGYLMLKMKSSPDQTSGMHGTPTDTIRCGKHMRGVRVAHWGTRWTINGISPKTAPAALQLDELPGCLCAVEAQLYSPSAEASFSTEYSRPNYNRASWRFIHSCYYNIKHNRLNA